MYITYFISDLHLGHKNVIKFDNRPFNTIEEHDEYIISQWNKTVDDYDDVYILGDISWYNIEKTIAIIKRLNGRLHLCLGNHDRKLMKNKDLRALFVEIVEKKDFVLNGKHLVLNHHPELFFNHAYHNGYHFYGHVHNSPEWNYLEQCKKEIEDIEKHEQNMFNVGCMLDYMAYTPRTFEEIINGAKNITVWEQVDETKQRCTACDTIFLIATYPDRTNNFCPNCGRKIKYEQ